jgi:lysophospholipid acyltransferase (LPLAT)-like uncharacterized protein
MKTSSLSGCHVNEVPLRFKPFVFLFGYGIAILGYIYCCLVHFTSKIVFIGRENLNKNSNYIICFWHQHVFLYFSIFLRNRHHAWMQHPIWFMKPSHIFLHLIGVSKIVLGSTGHSGKEAADKLVGCLKEGYSTVIMPDGPYGPPFVMKKGALHMSIQSNVPIVPLRFKTSRALELNHWDRRLWPLPFTKYTVEFGEPYLITNDNIESKYELISKALG